MQSQVSTNAVDHSIHYGAAVQVLRASGPVLPLADFVNAIGGAAGIVCTLTGHIYPTGDPAAPTFLYQVHHAVKTDAGAGVVVFIDSAGGLFNGQSSYQLLNQYQWAIFIFDGTNWTCIGS